MQCDFHRWSWKNLPQASGLSSLSLAMRKAADSEHFPLQSGGDTLHDRLPRYVQRQDWVAPDHLPTTIAPHSLLSNPGPQVRALERYQAVLQDLRLILG